MTGRALNGELTMPNQGQTEEMECDSLAKKLKVDAATAAEFSSDDGAAELLQELADRQYGLITQAWHAEVFIESVRNEKGNSMRPLTPFRLIEDMMDRLGDISGRSVLTFNIEFVPLLVERGAKVTLMTRGRCEAAKNFVSSPTLGIQSGYLTMEEVMADEALKFDVVIGNPPYQESANVGTPIWQEFVELGFKVLVDGGKIALIHPPDWRGTGNTKTGSMAEVREMMRGSDIEWLSMTGLDKCGKVFPGIAIMFDAYVARKSDTPGFVTEIEGTDGRKFKACIKEMDFIPNFECDDLGRIIANDGEERVDYFYASRPYHGTQKWMSKEKKGKFVHPCVWSISRNVDLRDENGGKLKFYYSNTKSPKVEKPYHPHFGTPKVIISIWQQSGIPYVDATGEYGMCQEAAAIADDPKVLPLIAKAMDGYRFRNAMAAVRFKTRDWNKSVIEILRRDFWKEFVNDGGDWIDKDGNVIDRDGNLVQEKKSAKGKPVAKAA